MLVNKVDRDFGVLGVLESGADFGGGGDYLTSMS